ncbi:MAG: 3-hydroxyacyl-CoA dehydrogenase NAD-binding domain-containing protein [Pseudomonadota bacterium]
MSTDEKTISTVGVIGGGLIGISWSALFLAHNLDVCVYDPSAETREGIRQSVEDKLPVLKQLGFSGHGKLTVTDTVEAAIETADFVQENAPERSDLKLSLFQEMEEIAPDHTIFASSTSSLGWSDFSTQMKAPGRAIVAHPFNPPHLLPLVEIYGVDEEVVSRARSFYESLSRTPIRIRKEVPGHIANRLSSALFQEAVHLVAEGIADAGDVDKALKAGPGVRWAAIGVFLGYHLGGGEGGIQHYLSHLGASQEARWAALGSPQLSDDVKQKIIDQVLYAIADNSIADLEKDRDHKLIHLLKDNT